jgi:antitoxin CptB
MAETLETCRKRLRFRSWHRGTKELDLLLGPFADAYLIEFNEHDLACYDALLTVADPDIYAWIVLGDPVDPTHNNDVMRKIIAFNNRSQNVRTS